MARCWSLFLLAGSLLVGCIADTRYGCELSKDVPLVAKGQPEGLIYARHGCPDQVIEVGNAIGKAIEGEPGNRERHWRKYIVVYRIGEGHELVGPVYQSDRFSNIAYLVADGKVLGGAHVGGGQGEAILGSLPLGGLHTKHRGGYGGDEAGYYGGYGVEGRHGVEGQR
jgi:hypothetical protein